VDQKTARFQFTIRRNRSPGNETIFTNVLTHARTCLL